MYWNWGRQNAAQLTGITLRLGDLPDCWFLPREEIETSFVSIEKVVDSKNKEKLWKKCNRSPLKTDQAIL